GAERAGRQHGHREDGRNHPGHHGSGSPRWVKVPVGPSSSSRAMATLLRAPSTTSISALGFMSVFTAPGWMALTLIAVSRSSQAKCTVEAFSALLDALYAGSLVP